MLLSTQDDEPPEKKPESEIKEEVYDDSIDDFHRDDFTLVYKQYLRLKYEIIRESDRVRVVINTKNKLKMR